MVLIILKLSYPINIGEDEKKYTVFGENGKWWKYDKNEKLIRSCKDAEQTDC